MWGRGGHCPPLSTPGLLITCRAIQAEGRIPPCFFLDNMLPFSFKHKQYLVIYLLELSCCPRGHFLWGLCGTAVAAFALRSVSQGMSLPLGWFWRLQEVVFCCFLGFL